MKLKPFDVFLLPLVSASFCWFWTSHWLITVASAALCLSRSYDFRTQDPLSNARTRRQRWYKHASGFRAINSYGANDENVPLMTGIIVPVNHPGKPGDSKYLYLLPGSQRPPAPFSRFFLFFFLFSFFIF